MALAFSYMTSGMVFHPMALQAGCNVFGLKIECGEKGCISFTFSSLNRPSLGEPKEPFYKFAE